MEEYIKILEDIIKDFNTHTNIYDEGFTIIYEKQINAIENLIKGYRELEKENAILKKANNIAENVKVENIICAIDIAYKDFMKEFIPKSKLEQRKQELEYDQLENPKNICENRIKIECIKELMGGE